MLGTHASYLMIRKLFTIHLTSVTMFVFRIISVRWVPFIFVSPKDLHILIKFLINEDETIGSDGLNIHGPDSVISMVDWTLGNHNFGETVCIIHADNYVGQKKNQYVLGYFMWRVMTGQHSQIEYKMQAYDGISIFRPGLMSPELSLKKMFVLSGKLTSNLYKTIALLVLSVQMLFAQVVLARVRSCICLQ
ncbi:hypothetical protein KUTeg_005454, partial [Tegillarca granosa]